MKFCLTNLTERERIKNLRILPMVSLEILTKLDAVSIRFGFFHVILEKRHGKQNKSDVL